MPRTLILGAGLAGMTCAHYLKTDRTIVEKEAVPGGLAVTHERDGFSFDVEILYLARRAGLRIVEVPVDWYNDEATRVDALRDSARMFVDLLRIRWLHRTD